MIINKTFFLRSSLFFSRRMLIIDKKYLVGQILFVFGTITKNKRIMIMNKLF
jgi:hypothetical protein